LNEVSDARESKQYAKSDGGSAPNIIITTREG